MTGENDAVEQQEGEEVQAASSVAEEAVAEVFDEELQIVMDVLTERGIFPSQENRRFQLAHLIVTRLNTES